MLTRFEGEVENKILLPTFISMLDGKARWEVFETDRFSSTA